MVSAGTNEQAISVLYIDDEPQLLTITRKMLERSGNLTITTASSAPEAIRLLGIGRYDAIVSDYQMPEMNGIEFLKHIRAAGDRTPFIIFTGRSREEVVIEALNNGADFFLQKGGDPMAQYAELAKKISYAVGMRRAAIELRTTKEYLENLVDCANAPIIVWGPDERITRFNRAFENLTGIPAPEALGAPLELLFPDESRDDSMAMIRAAMAGERWDAVEIPILNRSGDVRTVLWNSATITAPDGTSLLATIAQGQDITGRKQAEIELERKHTQLLASHQQLAEIEENLRSSYEELAASRERIREREQRSAGMIQFLPDATLVIDTTGTVIAWNRAMEEMTGIPAHAMIGRGSYEYALPFYGERRPILIDLALNFDDNLLERYTNVQWTGATLEAETILARPGGRERILWGRAAPLYDHDGRCTGAIESIRDVTDQRRAEKALQESEERYRNVVEDQTEFICRFLPDGRLVFVNEAYCRYFGLVREGVIGSRYKPSIYPEDRTMVREFFASLTPEHPVKTIDHRIMMPDGSICWQRWSNRAIFGTNGTIREYQSVGRDITESKDIEARLRESEEQLHNFISNLPLGLYRNTPGSGGRYLMANPSIARMHGYETLEEFMSVPTADLYENPAERIRFSDELIRAGRIIGRELRLRRKRGEIFWGRVSAVAVRDQSGVVRYFDGFIEDVTDQKQVEEALRQSKEQYRLIAENTADNIWIFDMDFRLRYVSPSVEKMKGFTVEESLAQSVQEMLTSASYAALLQRFGEEMALEATGTADPDRKVSFETEEYCRDGSTIQVENSITLLRDEQGRPVGMLGVSRDITERKKAEAALRESEEKYRNLVENLSEIIYILDEQARITYISPTIESIGGYTSDEVIGKRFIDFVHTEDRDERPGQFQRILAAGSAEPTEYRFIARDGRVVWVRTAARPVIREGRVTGVQGVLTDITDRKQAEDALRLAHRKLRILSGITRHDILNQVMALEGFLALAGDLTSGPKQAGYLDQVGMAATTILRHSEFTRAYEELGLGQPAWFPVSDLVGKIGDRRLPLRNDCGEVSLYADPMIEKVFSNLLDNTLRHGTGATRVHLSCEESEDDLRLIWEDDGCGIPADQKERIFERGVGKNTGFGLLLSREILAITGITITETGEPSRGARFEMAVPDGSWRRVPPANAGHTD